MDQLNAIIDRLRLIPSNNGCFNVLVDGVNRYRKAIEERNGLSLDKAPMWLCLQSEVTRHHDDINGFLWGLRAADFITDSERDQAVEELNALNHLD